jgi:hypothetical protein
MLSSDKVVKLGIGSVTILFDVPTDFEIGSMVNDSDFDDLPAYCPCPQTSSQFDLLHSMSGHQLQLSRSFGVLPVRSGAVGTTED